nr:hypothetical protein HUO10_000356 [Paraburkholderia busanensis]
MKNSRKIAYIFLFSFASAGSVFAGNALIFNDSGLIGFREGRAVFGIYDSRNATFSCRFLFIEDRDAPKKSNVENYTDTSLLTYVLSEKSFEFSNRNKLFDISADLYRRDNEWVIQKKSGQAGCENSAGTFTFGLKDLQSVTYYVTQEMPAIGIRIVSGKTRFYDIRGGNFVPEKSYLVDGDAVVELKTKGDYSYIRYVGMKPTAEGHVTFGWLRTNALVDPFPSK